ncbi:GNAT family N-acetyltransferase [Micromonospora wenchangensis]|uniref:GNAT family N-acetyltransferase n=1 Tax=Micromonospora wenchangensis TaxID=1185415 RepID=UPI0037F89D7E
MTPAAIAGVRRAQPGDVATIAALLTDAVMRDPVAEWLVPDPVGRRSVFSELLAMDVDHAVEWDTIDVALDMTAVAVWRHHPNDDLLSRHHLATITDPALPRFRHYSALVNSYRSPAPHHWLTWLYVAPSRRGLGIGRRLLAHHHQVVDRLGVPVDLVVSTERARGFLHHHGYRAGLPLHLPSGPRLWPLRRPARPVAAHRVLPARSA